MNRILICAGLLAIGGASPAATAPAAPVALADPMPTKAAAFVAAAGSSDLYEIDSSRLALQRSQNAQVRDFAQMMIDHHTKTTQTVAEAARSAGMNPPPPSLLPPQRAMLDKLQPANGAAFDRLYLDQQRKAHQAALGLHQNYAKNGDTPALRQAASGAVPIVQQHIDHLKTMTAR